MPSAKRTISTHFLHDPKKAHMNINEKGSRYGISGTSDLILHENDFRRARKVYQTESEIVLDGSNELTDRGVFQGTAYVLISSVQKYQGQVDGFDAFLDWMSARRVGKNASASELSRTFKKSSVNFYRQKAYYIARLANEWGDLDILERIQENIGTSREHEVALRKSLVADIKGLGDKTASLLLRMCGAEHVVPIDSLMLEWLYFHGYPCEMHYSKAYRKDLKSNGKVSVRQRKRDIKRRQYLQVEEFALDLSKKYSVPGYLLQLAVWAKRSTYSKM